MSSRAGHHAARYRFDLSPRQREVLDLVARGRTNAEIAEALGITLDGAKWHVREILAKLQVQSREEAAAAWRSRNRPGARLARALLGLTWPATAIRATLATAIAAGAVAGGVVLYESLRTGGEGAQAAATAGAVAAPAATPTADTSLPACNSADLALSVRVEPWLMGNLITVELVNNGPACAAAPGLSVSILPAPAGASAVYFSGENLAPGEQPPVQLVWHAECAIAGRTFELRASISGKDATVGNVPARGCVAGAGDSLFPAAKLDTVDGKPLPLLAACRTSQLALQAATQPAAAAMVVSVSVINSGPPCRLRARLSVEVIDAGGERTSGIFANPDAVGVYADVDPELGATVFAWENWCGTPGRFVLRLALGGLTDSLTVESPACADPAAGSQLRSTQGAGALVQYSPDFR